MAISHSPILHIASSATATAFVGFGVNYTPKPDNALAFFEWGAPASASDKILVENLMVAYRVREIFMGLATYTTAHSGSRKTLR